jgi:hypothetical protein
MEGFSKLELQSRMQRETREGLEVVEVAWAYLF